MFTIKDTSCIIKRVHGIHKITCFRLIFWHKVWKILLCEIAQMMTFVYAFFERNVHHNQGTLSVDICWSDEILIWNEYVLGISQKGPVIKIPAGGVYCPTTCSVSSPSSILNFSQDQAIIVIPTSLLNCTWDTMAPCTSITMICPAVVPKYTYKS